MWELSTITAVTSAIAAWIALLLSIVNVRTSRKALRLSEQQEERRKPSLSVYLQEGFISPSESARVYAFLLSVSNRSDNNNSVAEASLRLTYSKSEVSELTVRFPARAETPEPFRSNQGRMPIPTRVDAHQVVSGWYFFSVDNAIIENARVERVIVTLRDTHGNDVTFEPMLLREYSDETIRQRGEEDLPQAE